MIRVSVSAPRCTDRGQKPKFLLPTNCDLDEYGLENCDVVAWTE